MKSNTYDVVIAGGGVIGMSIAYYLSRDSNLSIAIVDKKKPGAATWASAGGLWAMGESVGLGCGVIFFHAISERVKQAGGADSVPFMPHMLPDFIFDFSLKSNEYFPELYQELLALTGLDFHYAKSGLMFIIQDDYDQEYADLICKHINRIYLKETRIYTKSELQKLEPYITKKAKGGLYFINDHQVNPYILVAALRAGAMANQVTVFEDDEVIDVKVKNNKTTSVTTAQFGEISCGILVNAAGVWAKDVAQMAGLDIPIFPVKGQVLLTEKLPKILHSAMSTNDCYIAQKYNGEILIGSTTEENDATVNCTYESIRKLAKGVVRAIPLLNNLYIKRTWSGLRPATPDEIAILGPMDELDGYLNACGHFRTGIVNAPITGVVLRDMILEQTPPIDVEPFLFKRFQTKSGDKETFEFLQADAESKQGSQKEGDK